MIGVTLVLSGACGTVLNLADLGYEHSGERRVYGGVRFDFEDFSRDDDARWDEAAVHVAFLIIDVPLCLVADTLTLPWTAFHAPAVEREEASSSP